MEVKHTPGPWERVDTADYAEIYRIGGESRRPIALVASSEDADAISALPDLLEALRETRDNIWNYWTPNTERGMKRRDALLAKADAAIAKAEGRS